jgi:hypothetical protein
MLRKITIGCAVVLAMLAAPVTLPAHSMGGFGGMHSSGGMHSFGGMHRFGMGSRSGSVHTFSHRANFPRHRLAHFAHFHHFDHFRHRHHFAHFHHFRHRHLFATAIGVGSCWRWVPTRFGWHRVWVCD